MVSLGFPKYPVRVKSKENKPLIFDPVRKKWSMLTPEEWVRVHCLYYLTETKGYPLSWIRVEQKIEVYTTYKRFDIVIQNPNKGIELLVECKSPSVVIKQSAFDQIAQYNLKLKSKYLMITNGLIHYFCRMSIDQKSLTFIDILPDYSE